MERQKSVKPSKHHKHTTPTANKWLIMGIIIFHAVGLIGLAITQTRPLFLTLVPFHLLLMLGLLVISHYKFNSKFLAFFSAIYLSGYFVEWVGTYTGWLFGSYSYGNTLGVKVFDVPLLMGVTWFLLIYATGVTMRLSGMHFKAFRALTGAALLTVLDWLIEPVAINLDYWHWEYEHIPLTNYASWFAISFILLYAFEFFRFKKQSWLAPVFLITQFIFFIALRFI